MINTLRNYIDDEWVDPARRSEFSLCNASTGKPTAPQMISSGEQIESALTAAANAHSDSRWSALPAVERSAALERIADQLEQRCEAIATADSSQTGVILSLTRRVAAICPAAFRAAAQLLVEPPAPALQGPLGDLRTERLPLGAAVVIAPWNAPSGIACHKLASALAAGCPAILKPSEWAPGSAQLIAEAIAEAGLPRGTFQLIHGDGGTGAGLIADDRIAAVSFTGGLAAGRAVARACAEDIKPAQLELGGNNPLVVLDDADLQQAAAGIVTGLTTLNGQWCRALGRLLVQESVWPQLRDCIAEKMSDLRLGAADDDTSSMGPLVHSGHRDHVISALQVYSDAGAELIRYGELPELGGWFVQPTLVVGLNGAQTIDEIFGPVACVHTFKSDTEALQLANQTPFGLAAYVFGEPDHAWQVAAGIRTGITKINGVTMLNLNPAAPRPAWGLSGLGDEGTRETFEFFRGTRVIGEAG